MIQPTPEQLGDWLAICTREERTKYAEHAMKAISESNDCFHYNHLKVITSITDNRDYYKKRNEVLEKAYLLATTGSLEDDLTTDDEEVAEDGTGALIPRDT